MTELKSLPGPIGLPIAGSAFSLGQNPAETLFDWSKQHYGPVFRLKIGSKDVLAIQGYDAMYEALVEKGEDFAGRVQNDLFRAMRNNNGLFFVKYGEHWEIWRQFAKTGLHDINANIQKSFASESNYALGLYGALSATGEPVSLINPMLLTMANSLIQMIFSTRFELQDPEFVELVLGLYAESPYLRDLTFLPWLGYFPPYKQFLQQTDQLRKKVIGKITKMIKDHGCDKDKQDLVSTFYKDNPTPDERTLKSFAFLIEDFLFAGSATTNFQFTWALLFLIRNPDKMKKLKDEMDSCLEGTANPIATAIENNFEGLNYLKAVADEGKRLRPIAPLSMARETLKETSLMGFKVPKGMIVFPNIWSVHHDEKTFPEPGKFKPERFINSSGEYEPNQQVMPFGMGLRRCVGHNVANLGIRTYLLTLLYHYDVDVVTPLTDVDMVGTLTPTLAPPDVPMMLTKRK